jgi:hypothetical protein
MVAANPLLVDGGARFGKIMSFVKDVKSILSTNLVFLLGVVDNTRRVVFQVSRQDSLGTIDHEEGSEPS